MLQKLRPSCLASPKLYIARGSLFFDACAWHFRPAAIHELHDSSLPVYHSQVMTPYPYIFWFKTFDYTIDMIDGVHPPAILRCAIVSL